MLITAGLDKKYIIGTIALICIAKTINISICITRTRKKAE